MNNKADSARNKGPRKMPEKAPSKQAMQARGKDSGERRSIKPPRPSAQVDESGAQL
jgi:hypothetical protein